MLGAVGGGSGKQGFVILSESRSNSVIGHLTNSHLENGKDRAVLTLQLKRKQTY